MSENILVSVCCITYNHEKFIGHTLDGFLMQKINFPVEFLINDDCSKDKTADVIKKYDKLHPGFFKITYQTENQFYKGVKPFSHLLFPKVKGKYIALCEGDDYWTDPLKLQKQVDFLEQNKDYSMCFHRSIIIDENNNEFESNIFNHLEEKDYNGFEILEKWSVPTASVVFRTKYINQIIERGKNPGYYYGDTPMFLTLLEYGKAHCFQDCMAVYRVHKGGISKKINPNKFINWYNDYKTIKLDFAGKYKNVININIANIAFGASICLTKQGYLLYGIKFFVRSLFYDRRPFKKYIVKKWKSIYNKK